MTRESDTLKPIHLEISAIASPAAVFKAITSQTELRKWWASRVILSKNIVAQEEGREMEMRLLQSEKNHLVRYSWKMIDDPNNALPTVITFEIEDRGVSRGNTGEGITLIINHDGWSNEEERAKQEKIWLLAIEGLKNLIENRAVKPWWEIEQTTGSFRPVKMQTIKQFLEKVERASPRAKNSRKSAATVIGRLCANLDGQGNWFQKQNGNEIELRFKSFRVFGALRNGYITFRWRELEKMAGSHFHDFVQRLQLEQELDLHIGKLQEKISAISLNPDLLSQWYIDVLQHYRDNS